MYVIEANVLVIRARLNNVGVMVYDKQLSREKLIVIVNSFINRRKCDFVIVAFPVIDIFLPCGL